MERSNFVRGLVYFGRIHQVLLYLWRYRRLEHSIEIHKAPDSAIEENYIKFRTAKERILFGQSFNELQRRTYDRLTFHVSESTIQRLLLGRYLTESGRIQRNKILDNCLMGLVCCTLIITALWLIGVSGEIALLNTVSLAVKAQVIVTLIALISIPSIYLAYIAIEPIIGYREYQRSRAYIGDDESANLQA
ncbi:MAG: hypothetical protein K6L75_03290 [Cellvibrionaceae bacterium]|nr:hypothetical protein [Motiliproteus sp.]MCW9052149.1 hypothetical protein [Motiliproteus sp.]